jgi:membrane associated rhomboid family serine protease
MDRSNLDIAHHVLLACYNRGSAGFFPRVDSGDIDLERRAVDEALDQLRLGGFVEIASWAAGKGQGYRVTEDGAKAVSQPQLLSRPKPVREVNPYQKPEFQSGTFHEVRQSILFPPPALATPILIALNVIGFVATIYFNIRHGNPLTNVLNGIMVAIPGRLVPDEFFAGEWWLLITYAFLHGGLIHIGVNMYSLYSLGNVLEGRWGVTRYLILYFGSALAGGAAVVLVALAEVSRAATGFEARGWFIGTVGASGAICGLLTSLAIWAWMHRKYLPPELVQGHFRVVGINLILLVGVSQMIPNISNSCHIGGAIGGAILSVPLAWMADSAPPRRRLLGWVTIVALFVAVMAVLAFVPRPDPLEIHHFRWDLRLHQR